VCVPAASDASLRCASVFPLRVSRSDSASGSFVFRRSRSCRPPHDVRTIFTELSAAWTAESVEPPELPPLEPEPELPPVRPTLKSATYPPLPSEVGCSSSDAPSVP
jgi:hypothetical protein